MDDDQKDVAIIEASALLVTLIFIILSLHMSYYAQWYAIWRQVCSADPQSCTWPPDMAAMSALVGTLEPYSYLVGFFFVMAAFAATIRLFSMVSPGLLAGLRFAELAFFLSGLIALAVVFFARAPKDVYTLGLLILVSLCITVVSLRYARHHKQWRTLEPL